ncbi:ATP synthase mitochondrial F1 complex assembly factor 1-like isoform X2 [Pollicipes pollicipes]|nr:ATP synthase mitochondrial F1 complex assembly factor 1-like isoform X2 [Pollicipes pollicipes]XP_037077697.1 ATP synthase mitochondrial F1 complex assembly factor 1-like isoform X2 [Pollicipes pollicipes]XP_037077698.1 ATP synthase mitochondrial F1 complex assembly factor 1-like isoform X2 [Pollicipes pollicipes]XP_037077700.1 ATP synthase mitochondrial F1 complex assembly factor 1-like isoform X2 [Pollicipes pollicipes]XP_037077701.1 ATP synthase mitochondrial F1 complex assembly factor 1-
MRWMFVQTLRQTARLRTANILPRLPAPRLIHTTPTMAEEYIEKLKNENPYFSKYAEKIAKLQQTSAEELERRVQEKSERDRATQDSAAARSFSVKAPKPAAAEVVQAKPKMLNDVLKLELIQDKSSEEIGKLWTEYFKTKDSVSAVIPAKDYQDIAQNAAKYPTFLFPLPRDQGYEFVVAQFAGNEAHFTPLINYQAYKENAPECMAMVHYPELAESKGVVLMAAEYDSTVLNASEAQCLANEMQLYYCRPSERRRQLLDQFTTQPEAFRYQELISVLESIQLS